MKVLIDTLMKISEKIKKNSILLSLFCLLVIIGAALVFIYNKSTGIEYIYNQF